MASAQTPIYPNTLVSGELNKVWKQSDIYDTIFQNDKSVYDDFSKLQVNGKGRIIEIVVTSPEIRTKLLSVGLQIGNETVLFRPYRLDPKRSQHA